ncbi:MAG: hypothetical protein A2099_03815 [Planctomycetes bacterium GWF2_39_10]|nr:MAG: hypothetical protein A2Y09_05750 [Planctomycetes bacterium GWA2_39_15]OHB47434.1 MAG: hypothetical protein A2099_03815 [Planctomycetes bacterium GWF2_39_10]
MNIFYSPHFSPLFTTYGYDNKLFYIFVKKYFNNILSTNYHGLFNIQIVVFIDIVDTIYGIFFTRIFKKNF